MSLTHYWKQQRPFSSTEWFHIVDAAKSICSRVASEGIDLVVDITKEGIHVNGTPGSDQEDFILIRPHLGDSDSKYNNVKTAWKPYDLAVCTILIAVREIAPTSIDLKSDGKWDDQYWLKARHLYEELFETKPGQGF